MSISLAPEHIMTENSIFLRIKDYYNLHIPKDIDDESMQ